MRFKKCAPALAFRAWSGLFWKGEACRQTCAGRHLVTYPMRSSALDPLAALHHGICSHPELCFESPAHHIMALQVDCTGHRQSCLPFALQASLGGHSIMACGSICFCFQMPSAGPNRAICCHADGATPMVAIAASLTASAGTCPMLPSQGTPLWASQGRQRNSLRPLCSL